MTTFDTPPLWEQPAQGVRSAILAADCRFLAAVPPVLPELRATLDEQRWQELAGALERWRQDVDLESRYGLTQSVDRLVEILKRERLAHRRVREALDERERVPRRLGDSEADAPTAEALARAGAGLADALVTQVRVLTGQPLPRVGAELSATEASAILQTDRRFVETLRRSLPHVKRVLGPREWVRLARDLAAWQRTVELVDPYDLVREVDRLVQKLASFPAVVRLLQDAIAEREALRTRGVIPEAAVVPASSLAHDLALADGLAGEAGALSRYLTVSFTQTDQSTPVPASEPLVAGQTYRLKVNIGAFEGLGEPDVPVLAGVWPRPKRFAVLVVIDATHPEVLAAPPEQQLLYVSRDPREASAPVHFTVSAVSAGVGTLAVDVLYNGVVLQSKTVEAHVVAPGDLWPADQPAQSARVRASYTLSFERVPARVVTVVVERQQDDTFRLRWYHHVEGEPLLNVQTQRGEAALGGAVRQARGALREAIAAYYAQGERAWDLATATKSLALLALAGRALYRTFLAPLRSGPFMRGPGADAEPEAALAELLAPGALIQINALTPTATVPWEVAYAWPVGTYTPGVTRVCPDYRTHSVEACPHLQRDGSVVCPLGFWGFRYVIEQLPAWWEPDGSNLGEVVANGPQTHVALGVNPSFTRWQQHYAFLQQLGPGQEWQVSLADSRALARQALAGGPVHLIELYVHGGVDDQLGPYFKIRDREYLTLGDWEAWQINWWPTAPLVFINGCETGAYGPEAYLSFVEQFQKAGASAVIGTQCPIYEGLAVSFANAFFAEFTTGTPVGEALRRARLALLQAGNPFGLAYSLYALADTRLARPVSAPSARGAAPRLQAPG